MIKHRFSSHFNYILFQCAILNGWVASCYKRILYQTSKWLFYILHSPKLFSLVRNNYYTTSYDVMQRTARYDEQLRSEWCCIKHFYNNTLQSSGWLVNLPKRFNTMLQGRRLTRTIFWFILQSIARCASTINNLHHKIITYTRIDTKLKPVWEA